MAPVEKSTEDTIRQRKENRLLDETDIKENGAAHGHVKNLVEWKKHMEVVKAEMVETMSCQMKDLLDKAVTDSLQSYTRDNVTSLSDKKRRNEDAEKGKIFIQRASLLDELMEVEHFRTIYHMFVAALCVFVISTVAVDLIDQGRLVLEFDVLFYTFGQFSTVVWLWICLFIYALLVPYKTLHFWGSRYSKSKHPFLLSASVISIFGICQFCVLGVFPPYIVLHYKLPPASSFVVILEQVRFLMKTYSFVRETVPSVIQKERNPDKLPKLSSYLYYLFCPTLIYRDRYPRTPYIRWSYVAKNFAQFLGCLFFGYFTLVTLCIPVFTNMSKQPFHMRTLVLSFFHATLPGTFVLLITFFAFLHCWLNAFAEMLRFADRMFYKDWWNSKSFSNYYRTWNVVVHDWLYYYVYRDILLEDQSKKNAHLVHCQDKPMNHIVGSVPFLVSATCGTTVFGAFDPLQSVADVCKRHGIWLHIDAALGGSALLSNKHRHLLNCIDRADSVTWNPHKMLGVGLQCSAFLLKDTTGLLEQCHAANATYLFQTDKFYSVKYDTGDKSIQCGRRVDCLKLWLMWKALGSEGLERRVDDALAHTRYLVEEMKKRDGFILVMEPEFVNLCFWYVPPSLRAQKHSPNFWEKLGKVAPVLKERMIKKGSMMIGYQPHENHVNFFRQIVVNPESTKEDLDFFLNEIERLGENL
ncbi:sterol O-acyltransferase 2 [Pelobates cultripes]|uniref:Sterol O-acyltransferase 2 n=1 Tax=Pelobates cultripes TaxID=61616 RepID=A0AAD1R8Z8_PELCU|nr:sterol O-acyltransferase 2 [Pelobates cultripes]